MLWDGLGGAALGASAETCWLCHGCAWEVGLGWGAGVGMGWGGQDGEQGSDWLWGPLNSPSSCWFVDLLEGMGF